MVLIVWLGQKGSSAQTMDVVGDVALNSFSSSTIEALTAPSVRGGLVKLGVGLVRSEAAQRS